MSHSSSFWDIPQIFCKSCTTLLEFTPYPATKTKYFVFHNGPNSGKEETAVYASSSKNAFFRAEMARYCPGQQQWRTGRKRKAGFGNLCWMLLLQPWARGFKSFKRGIFLLTFQPSSSRYLMESILLTSCLRQAPIQAVGTSWVSRQHRQPAHSSSPRQLTNGTVCLLLKLRCWSSCNAWVRQWQQTVCLESSPLCAFLVEIWNPSRST